MDIHYTPLRTQSHTVCIYILTPWSRVLLEELTGFQLVKKFPTFYGTWRFITSLTSARHLSLSWARHEAFFVNSFNGDKLLASHPTPKLGDHTLSNARNCLFNIFAATLHTGGHSSIPKLRMHHAMVTGTHLSWVHINTTTTLESQLLYIQISLTDGDLLMLDNLKGGVGNIL